MTQEKQNAEIRATLDRFDIEGARTLLREALKSPTAETYYLASMVAVNNWQREEFLRQALELDPSHKDANLEFSRIQGYAPGSIETEANIIAIGKDEDKELAREPILDSVETQGLEQDTDSKFSGQSRRFEDIVIQFKTYYLQHPLPRYALPALVVLIVIIFVGTFLIRHQGGRGEDELFVNLAAGEIIRDVTANSDQEIDIPGGGKLYFAEDSVESNGQVSVKVLEDNEIPPLPEGEEMAVLQNFF